MLQGRGLVAGEDVGASVAEAGASVVEAGASVTGVVEGGSTGVDVSTTAEVAQAVTRHSNFRNMIIVDSTSTSL